MSSTLTLQDGRVFGTSNGVFDSILELVAAELNRRPDSLLGFADWLLSQRCAVLVEARVGRRFAPHYAGWRISRRPGDERTPIRQATWVNSDFAVRCSP